MRCFNDTKWLCDTYFMFFIPLQAKKKCNFTKVLQINGRYDDAFRSLKSDAQPLNVWFLALNVCFSPELVHTMQYLC